MPRQDATIVAKGLCFGAREHRVWDQTNDCFEVDLPAEESTVGFSSSFLSLDRDSLAIAICVANVQLCTGRACRDVNIRDVDARGMVKSITRKQRHR